MKGPALGADVVRLIGLAQKQYWRALGFNRRLKVLNEKADLIQERLNFLGKHCSEEMVERCHSEVRQEDALKQAAQRQLVILEGDEKRRTTYPGLLPAEKKKPLRKAPWEEASEFSDDLPEVELVEEAISLLTLGLAKAAEKEMKSTDSRTERLQPPKLHLRKQLGETHVVFGKNGLDAIEESNRTMQLKVELQACEQEERMLRQRLSRLGHQSKVSRLALNLQPVIAHIACWRHIAKDSGKDKLFTRKEPDLLRQLALELD
eukprot:g32074.t1